MKKLPFLLFSMYLLFSCESSDITSNETNAIDQDLPVVKKILEQGYKIEDIKDCKEFYLVQDDILFSKKLKDYDTNQIEDRHAATTNLVSQQNRIITVRIDASIPQTGKNDWRGAITAAMSNWSNISGNSIAFVSYYDNNPDILIKSDNNSLPSNVIAAAGFPYSNGKPYSEILINFDFNNNMTVSEGSKRYNVAHELGHCIGFRHTNWDINGEGVSTVGANYIPNTPSQDSNSIMNGGTALYSWNGFSNYDIVAVNYLYPTLSCNSRLEGPAVSTCAYDRYNDPIDYNVYLIGSKQTIIDNSAPTWTITGNSLEIFNQGNYACKVRVKSNNTIWPATGTVTMQKASCSTTFYVSLNNCQNLSYTD